MNTDDWEQHANDQGSKRFAERAQLILDCMATFPQGKELDEHAISHRIHRLASGVRKDLLRMKREHFAIKNRGEGYWTLDES